MPSRDMPGVCAAATVRCYSYLGRDVSMARHRSNTVLVRARTAPAVTLRSVVPKILPLGAKAALEASEMMETLGLELRSEGSLRGRKASLNEHYPEMSLVHCRMLAEIKEHTTIAWRTHAELIRLLPVHQDSRTVSDPPEAGVRGRPCERVLRAVRGERARTGWHLGCRALRAGPCRERCLECYIRMAIRVGQRDIPACATAMRGSARAVGRRASGHTRPSDITPAVAGAGGCKRISCYCMHWIITSRRYRDVLTDDNLSGRAQCTPNGIH